MSAETAMAFTLPRGRPGSPMNKVKLAPLGDRPERDLRVVRGTD
jgi:hypothetical protein